MNKWLQIYIDILDGKENIPSPFHKDGILESAFIIIDRAGCKAA